MPTISRLRTSSSGAWRALSWAITYRVAIPMTTKEARKITETMPMILQLSLLEKDLLFILLYPVRDKICRRHCRSSA